MKKYRVIYQQESSELTIPFGEQGLRYGNTYYDVDGKVCYNVKIFMEKINQYITLKSDTNPQVIFNKIFNDSVEFQLVDEYMNSFEDVANDDYKQMGERKVLERNFYEFRDIECSEEVQEEYSKYENKEDFFNKSKSICEF